MSSGSATAGSLVGERLGKYELLALLALGGSAEIYLARIGGHAGFEKYVVIKCLHDHLADDAEFVPMFLDEARLGAQLDHSNIVQTLELGEHQGRYFMAMEYLAGMSLAYVARRVGEREPDGRIPVPLVLGLIAQACAGLHYAHERTVGGTALGVVHRDISPQNLVVSFEGVLKVVDFGIAKAALRETNTRAGTIKGKFAYMSPEQCLAQSVDRRTDVFALGVIAHELLTGQRLFKRASTYETYQAILACKVPPPSTMNPALDGAVDEVVMGALQHDRERRYPTAEAFGEAVSGLLHRRGNAANVSDIARWFDARFGAEIDDHAQRMRELIEGRAEGVGELGQWDEPEAESELLLRRPGDSVAEGLPELGGAGAGAGEEPPAEPTRIELNPLARVQALHAAGEASEAAAAAAIAAAPAAPAVAAAAAVLSSAPASRGPAAPSAPVPAPPAPAPVSPSPVIAPVPAARPVGPLPASLFGGEAAAAVASSSIQSESDATKSGRIQYGLPGPSQARTELAPLPPVAAPSRRDRATDPMPMAVLTGPAIVPTVIATLPAGAAPSPALAPSNAEIAAAQAAEVAAFGRPRFLAPESHTVVDTVSASASRRLPVRSGVSDATQPMQVADGRFPPVETPTAFTRGPALEAAPGAFGHGDLNMHAQPSARAGKPRWLLAAAFLGAIAIGVALAIAIAAIAG